MASTVVDGVARCRFSDQQKEEICRLFELDSVSKAFALERGWHLLHELEIIIERYWYEDGRYTIWPSDATLTARENEIVECARRLKSLLEADDKSQFLIANSDLRARPRQDEISGMFDIQTFVATLTDFIGRAELVRDRPLGRETIWEMRSNRQDRAFDRLLCDLIRFWHIDLAKPMPIEGVKTTSKSTLAVFCRHAAELAGRTMEGQALRNRVKNVLKQMDANDGNKRGEGLPPTLSWRI